MRQRKDAGQWCGGGGGGDDDEAGGAVQEQQGKAGKSALRRPMGAGDAAIDDGRSSGAGFVREDQWRKTASAYVHTCMLPQSRLKRISICPLPVPVPVQMQMHAAMPLTAAAGGALADRLPIVPRCVTLACH